MRAAHWTRCAAVVIAAALAGTAAGCGSPDSPAAMTGGAAPTAAPTADDARTTAAKQLALDAYGGYLAASRTAEQKGDPFHPDLRKYLADPLLTSVRVTVRDVKAHGATRTGTLRSDPTVTSVSLDAQPPTVVIQDCLDASGYRLIYRKNSAPVPGSAGGRYLVTATATRYSDGRWLISSGTAFRDQPC
ncbi:hypothetical protein [Plantactinospora sp. GCM10030261]|uniref:hypothetical protein n=1 Tax=Plantactinospora sp. GCM10030261 TaxID=3273420 RepID=UPI00360B4854